MFKAHAQRQLKLSLAQRERIFDRAVQQVTKKYFDPKFNGIDWPKLASESRVAIIARDDPEQFELAIHDLVRKLRTSHTGFFHKSVRRVPGRLAIGATFLRFESGNDRTWIIQDLHPGGPLIALG